MTKICLNMIVKNEGSIIERALLSVLPWIDYWVISDTGSTDDTKEQIQKVLKNIPGELLERPWVDFAYNRNEALDVSLGKGDYILFIDADETLEWLELFEKTDLQKDCYFVQAFGRTSQFAKTLFIKNDPSWRWQGVLHEIIVSSKKDASTEYLSKAKLIYDESSSYRSRNPQKYREDAKVLEKALKKEPDNSRYLFYLAQSHVHARQFDLALECYEKRAALKGDSEEVFWSLYCIGCLKEDLGYSSSEIIQAYSKAYQYKPIQVEPLYRLAMHLKERPFLADLVKTHSKTIPLPEKAARLQRWIYEFIFYEWY